MLFKILKKDNISGYVYLTTNLTTGKWYIGSSRKAKTVQEAKDHKYFGSCKELKLDIQENGKEIFKKQILMVCDNPYSWEQYFLRRNLLENSLTYNKSLYTNTVPILFGDNNPSRKKEVKEKIRKTRISRYGDSPQKCKEIRIKTQKTCLEKFGVINVLQSQAIKDKIEQTNLNKYQVKNPLSSDFVKHKVKKTCLEKFGFENPMLNLKVQDKRKKSCIASTGSEFPFNSKKIQDKIKETILKKYDVEKAGYLNRKPIQSFIIKGYQKIVIENFISYKDAKSKLNLSSGNGLNFSIKNKKPYKKYDFENKIYLHDSSRKEDPSKNIYFVFWEVV